MSYFTLVNAIPVFMCLCGFFYFNLMFVNTSICSWILNLEQGLWCFWSDLENECGLHSLISLLINNSIPFTFYLEQEFKEAETLEARKNSHQFKNPNNKLQVFED